MKITFLGTSHGIKLIISHRYDQVNPDGAVAELAEYTKDRFETVLAYDNMIWEL